MKYTRILFVAALTIAAISLPANAQLLGGVVRGSTNSAGSVGGRSGSVTGGLNSDSRFGRQREQRNQQRPELNYAGHGQRAARGEKEERQGLLGRQLSPGLIAFEYRCNC